jgi:DNA-binding transcriptional ArsR family regulator
MPSSAETCGVRFPRSSPLAESRGTQSPTSGGVVLAVAAASSPGLRPGRKPWLFLSHHAHILLAVNRKPDALARELAAVVGLTERSTQRILADLVREGYLERERVGRRNHYAVKREAPFRHPVLDDLTVGAFVDTLNRFARDPAEPSTSR